MSSSMHTLYVLLHAQRRKARGLARLSHMYMYIHACMYNGYLEYSKPIFSQLHGLSGILEAVGGNHLVALGAQTARHGVHQCGNEDAIIPVGRKVLDLSSRQLYCTLRATVNEPI